jgi:ArsR family transcriptional regulator
MRRLNPVEVFKVLSVDSRIRILEILKTSGPLGTNHIARILGITPAAISQHLKVMRQAGIVTSERDGYWIPHSIDEDAMEDCRQLMNHICQCHRPHRERERRYTQKDAIEVLKQYKRRLERELKAVEEKINDYED